jgi:hypothetical protein
MTQPDATPSGISPESGSGVIKSDLGQSGFPNDRRKRNIPIATDRRRAQNAAEKRKNSERRRLIDPTTCERDYNDEETEFMKAMDRYKRENRRPFPTWSEVLEVLSSLGYSQVAEATALPGGKREPTAPSPPTPLAALDLAEANRLNSHASESSPKPEPAPNEVLNNRRRRNIPVATDQRQETKGNLEESEFMGAMDRYKRQNRRPFPTWSEVLEVLRSLGYRRVSEMASMTDTAPDADTLTTPAPVNTPAPIPEPAPS